MRTIKGITVGVFCLIMLASVANARPANTELFQGGAEVCEAMRKFAGEQMELRQYFVSLRKALNGLDDYVISPPMYYLVTKVTRLAWDEPIKKTELGKKNSVSNFKVRIYSDCMGSKL